MNPVLLIFLQFLFMFLIAIVSIVLGVYFDSMWGAGWIGAFIAMISFNIFDDIYNENKGD